MKRAQIAVIAFLCLIVAALVCQVCNASYTGKFINGALLQFDDTTGALLVSPSASDATPRSFTATATTTDSAVVCIATDATNASRNAFVYNPSTSAGWFSVDGGTTWRVLPPQFWREVKGVQVKGIQIKRIAGGADLSGVIGDCW